MKHQVEYYRAKDLKGESYLYTPHDDTLDGVKQDIDESNVRAKSEGYNGSQWIITHMVVQTYTDKDDRFVMRETSELAIEVYPTEL